jgi:predicted oxidoreductase
VFRTLSEAFAALPAVNQATLSAYATHVDHATANPRNDYLVSVRVQRTQWERINFAALDQLDVGAALAQFELRRSLSSDGRFRGHHTALAWVIAHPDCTAPLVGPSRAAPHLGHLAEALELVLAPEERVQIASWFEAAAA